MVQSVWAHYCWCSIHEMAGLTVHHGNQAENIIRQEKINALIRMSQVNAVNNERLKHNRGSKGWWDTANRITGRKIQGTLVSSVIPPDVINTFPDHQHWRRICGSNASANTSRNPSTDCKRMWCTELIVASETNHLGAWWVSLMASARLLSPSCTCDHQNFQLLT